MRPQYPSVILFIPSSTIYIKFSQKSLNIAVLESIIIVVTKKSRLEYFYSKKTKEYRLRTTIVVIDFTLLYFETDPEFFDQLDVNKENGATLNSSSVPPGLFSIVLVSRALVTTEIRQNKSRLKALILSIFGLRKKPNKWTCLKT